MGYYEKTKFQVQVPFPFLVEEFDVENLSRTENKQNYENHFLVIYGLLCGYFW